MSLSMEHELSTRGCAVARGTFLKALKSLDQILTETVCIPVTLRLQPHETIHRVPTLRPEGY